MYSSKKYAEPSRNNLSQQSVRQLQNTFKIRINFHKEKRKKYLYLQAEDMLVDKWKFHFVVVEIEAKMATSNVEDGRLDEDKVEMGSWHQIAKSIC